MAYWWVSQNQSFDRGRKGGYLWAPLKDKGGKIPFHWATMHDVRPGDIVFSYVGKQIKCISTAKNQCYPAPRPPGSEAWSVEGVKIDVEYKDLQHPISIPNLPSQLIELLNDRYGPLDSAGEGNQGYLFPLSPRAGRELLGLTEASNAIQWGGMGTSADGAQTQPDRKTEREVYYLSRIGQGEFRDKLMDYWQGRCVVTGLSRPELLRASHIKPWKDSNNIERLDPYNGLLLSAKYDIAFDVGLITFQNDGKIALSSRLSDDDVLRATLDKNASIAKLEPRHIPYLEYHRQTVFD